MLHASPKGRLEVICGSMFSGKSEELIRRIRRAELGHLKVCVFKHKLDERMTIEYIYAHNGEKFKAVALDNPQDILPFITPDVNLVAIDEVQFFSTEVVRVVLDLVEMGKRVLVAGLDLDLRGLPFGPMPALMAVADSITKLNADCVNCGKDAHYTQRLINGKAAKFTDPVILIGAQECYQARCRDCYIIDQPWYISPHVTI